MAASVGKFLIDDAFPGLKYEPATFQTHPLKDNTFSAAVAYMVEEAALATV